MTKMIITPAYLAVAAGYRQANRIADQVMRRVFSPTKSFKLPSYLAKDVFNAPETLVGTRSAPNQITWDVTETTYSVDDHGLDAPVTNDQIEQWERARAAGANGAMVIGPDPRSRAVEIAMQQVQNRREKRVADLVMDANNYASTNKELVAASDRWSNKVDSDPIPYIMERLDSCLMRPTLGVISRPEATQLQTHPKVCKAVFGNNTDAGVAPLAAIADLLGLTKGILVGDSRVNIAKPGQTANVQRCWADSAAFLYVDDAMATVDDQVLTWGVTVQWGDVIAGEVTDPDMGLRGGVRMRAGESVKEVVTAGDLGFLLINTLA